MNAIIFIVDDYDNVLTFSRQYGFRNFVIFSSKSFHFFILLVYSMKKSHLQGKSPTIRGDDPLLPQAFQFPHHGAAVGSDVIGQGTEGKWQREGIFSAALRQLAKVAQQLFPNGAAGKHIHPHGQCLSLIGHQPEHILHQQAVVGAGVLTSFEDMSIIYEQHIAGSPADHLQAVVSGPGKGQGLSKDAARTQLLHHCGNPFLINADQRSLSPLDNAHSIILRRGKIIDHLIRPKGPLDRLKAGQHPAVFLIADVLKQGAFFQILLRQHSTRLLLLHISQRQ